MPERSVLTAQRSAEVLMTDYPWGEVGIEQAIFANAGLRLALGTSSPGAAEPIEHLVAKHNPLGILNFRAPLSARAIQSAVDLRIIARLGMVTDDIDIGAATAQGTWVTHVADCWLQEIADQAVALLLGSLRGIVADDHKIKTGKWSSSYRDCKRAAELAIGIIGSGPIVRALLAKLRPFACRILVHDPIRQTAAGCGVALNALQEAADAIVLHLPLTRQTTHFVDATFIAACKRRPVLVNVGPERLIDVAALAAGLEAGALGGAAIVMMDSSVAFPPHIIGRSDVIVIPHVSLVSKQGITQARRRACEEVVRVLQGDCPRHPCNRPDRGIPLGGGVASDIRIVAEPEREIVIKTALPKLKVAADWFSDPARSGTEVAALQAIAKLLGPEVVPRVLWSDPTRHRFAMERIEPGLRNWKQDLLAGRVDPLTAAKVGELLGLLHRRSAENTELARRFADDTYFQELRVVPYLRRIAARNPQLAQLICSVIEGMAQRRQAFVHGDYSPKNILADGARVVILDCEVAHWGDPRFDLAFVLAHLALKGLRRAADPAALADAGGILLAEYQRCGLSLLDSDLVKLVGCLVLARLEGDSPVDYLDDFDCGVAKRLAVSLLREQIPAVSIMQHMLANRQ